MYAQPYRSTARLRRIKDNLAVRANSEAELRRVAAVRKELAEKKAEEETAMPFGLNDLLDEPPKPKKRPGRPKGSKNKT